MKLCGQGRVDDIGTLPLQLPSALTPARTIISYTLRTSRTLHTLANATRSEHARHSPHARRSLRAPQKEYRRLLRAGDLRTTT